MTRQWANHYASRVQHERNDAIKQILRLTQRPEVISFAGGLPAAELFPREQVIEATRRVLVGERGMAALQYSIPEGHPPLRQMIADETRHENVAVQAENVLISSGSQQSLDLIGKLLIDPGDRILVEEPTYLGMLQAWRIYGARYETVATDECGLIPEALEEALRSGPAKLIYLVPNFQNPTGVTMTLRRRMEVVGLARQYRVPIVEDDAYGKLRYEGESVPSLLALDAQCADRPHSDGLADGNILGVGTFSKTLCPGFRVAWIIGPADVIARLAEIKEDGDLHTSTFAQTVLYELAHDEFYQQHINRLRIAYEERRNMMLSLMDGIFPPGTTWTRPEGGLFIWVRLPPNYDSSIVLKQAIQYGVAFVPGESFFPNAVGKNTFRLNFSNASPDRIREGMRRLKAALVHMS